MSDWIHTTRGVRLVEGTLPRLAKALEKLATVMLGKEVEYETYTQQCWNGDLSPTEAGMEEGWEPFAAASTVAHNGLRESLGGGWDSYETIWWRRKMVR